MKFFTLSIFALLFVGIFANQEMGPDQDPGEGRCNVYKKCPLKKKYRNSKLSKEELEKDKYHQCCSYYSHCGESIEYCGIGCQFGDCLNEYKDQTRQMLSCHPLYIQNRCSADCPCLNGACCSKHGYCGTTEEYCGEGNRMTVTSTTSFITLPVITLSKTTTTTTPTPTISIKKGMCGKGIGKCPDNQCCSKYGWCGLTKDHCYVSKGCQSEFGKCIETTTTTTATTTSTTKKTKKSSKTTTTKKSNTSSKKTTTSSSKKSDKKSTSKKTKTASKESTKGKCGKNYGKCPEDQCCSKYGYCGTSEKYCKVSSGCQSEYGKCQK